MSGGLGALQEAGCPFLAVPVPSPLAFLHSSNRTATELQHRRWGAGPCWGRHSDAQTNLEAQIMQGPKVWQSQWGPEAGIVPPYSPQPLGTALKSRERGVTSCAGINCVDLGKTEEWTKCPHLGTLWPPQYKGTHALGTSSGNWTGYPSSLPWRLRKSETEGTDASPACIVPRFKSSPLTALGPREQLDR